MKNLNEAEIKAKEAADLLEIAKKNYDLAIAREEQIRLQGKKNCILAEETRALTTKTYLSSQAESDDFFLKVLEERYCVEVFDKMVSTSTSIAFKRYKSLLTNKRYRMKKFLKNVSVLYRFYKKADGSVHFRDYDY